MKKIIIFSGTTEGRTLSEMFSKDKISHLVSVASDYGKEMMKENDFAKVHVGRMDAGEMKAFLSEEGFSTGDFVVDATHPYAKEVTANVREVSDKMNLNYIRVIREESNIADDRVRYYADVTECASSLNGKEGNILLTTGSKELGKICDCLDENTKKRLYVRVLPALESLQLCSSAGIEPDHIIAMHGPFGLELNKAIMTQYNIRHLVTKESGAAGGFTEKVEAALLLGAEVHVISRPVKEAGSSACEAFEIITGKEMPQSGESLKIFIAGVGMGCRNSRTLELENAIATSDLVFGSQRLVNDIDCGRKFSMYLSSDIIPVLETEKWTKAVILFSGDTGFYSGARKMAQALRKWRDDIDIEILPGISSFSYLASKLGESYEDAALCSLHGKNSEKDLWNIVDTIKYNSKVFALLSGAEDVSKLAEKLLEQGIDAEIAVGKDLSYENEKIIWLKCSEAVSFSIEGIVTAFVRNSSPQKKPLLNVRKDDFFIRDKVPMTKECVRHESIIRLGLRDGDIFYDIGGGTGSVAIEAASLCSHLKVTTIERKSEAVELISQNIKKAGLCNVDVICDDAINALTSLPKPDAVFIGGSGGKLREILDVLREKGTGIRVVINAVSIETIEEVRSVLREIPHEDEEAIMLAVTDLKEIGSYHLMQAQNPVWIFSFAM
jgi:precorrin-6Y C5,15-methyltransferase (decarboxylating)